MHEQMLATPLLSEYEPIRVSDFSAAPVYYERSISFEPGVYASTAIYETAALDYVAPLGETAVKAVFAATPVGDSYVKATAADMKAAYEIYAGIAPKEVPPAAQAAQAAHQ